MRVILREDMPNLGEAGEVVDVKRGYARNYLIPRKLAMEATEGNLKTFEHIAGAREKRAEKLKGDAESMAEKLAGQELHLEVEVGEEDQLYGSVTSQMIVDELHEKGFEVERRNVLLPAPIKELGTHEVPIHLHRDVEPVIKVSVVKRAEEEEGTQAVDPSVVGELEPEEVTETPAPEEEAAGGGAGEKKEESA
ncbi:MAG: 50S ribosomal protein L9 [bacterium]